MSPNSLSDSSHTVEWGECFHPHFIKEMNHYRITRDDVNKNHIDGCSDLYTFNKASVIICKYRKNFFFFFNFMYIYLKMQ